MESTILIVRIVKFKYLIAYQCRLVILSAQVYTMNSSSCTSQKDYLFSDSGINNQKMQEVSLSSHHSGLNPFILRMDDMILISEKIEALQFKTIVTARLLRVNGSQFVVPIEYAAILTQIIGCNETITFFPDPHDDFFLIGLRICLALTEETRNLTQDQQKEISLQLQKYRKFLTFVGSIKDKSINSLRFHKNNLKLKANIARSLKSNKILINQSQAKSQIFTNDNYPLIVASIKEESSKKCEGQRFVKKGGYFSVQKQQCQITKCDGSSFKQPLAIKKLRYDKNSNGGEARMNHELEMIKKMKNRKYLVNYYKPIGQQWFAMDFIEKNLKDLKYSQKMLSIKEIFSICTQLIEAVSLLHQSHIVHRDLKPENVLVDVKGQIKIKLIDFGESAQMGMAYDEKHRLGCTIPYSPIECMINCSQGYNNPAIDLWSVVIMIYQLIFKQMPVYYNRKMHHVLITGWKGQEQEFDFTTVLCHRPKRGLRKIQEYAYLLAQQGLKIEQKQRLKLPVILSYLKSLQIFYNDMISSLLTQN